MNKSLQKKLVHYSAAAILLTIALVQFYITKKIPVSPWKGGGFGMFSTVSAPSAYFVRVYATTATRQKTRITIPEKLKWQERKLRYFPLMTNLSAFKANLLKENWIFTDNRIVATIPTDTILSREVNQPVEINDISIELWQYKFDASTLKLYCSLLLKS